MKKIFSFLIPLLFLGLISQNSFFIRNINKNVDITSDEKILDFETGVNFNSTITDSNNDEYADTLYMWGDNSYGQLGDGTTNDKLTPTKITPQGQSNWGGNIIDLSLGNQAGSTIDTDLDGYADTLYMWGYNNFGQIGDGTTSNKLTPTIITPQGQSNWGGNIIDLSLGINHSAVTVDTNSNGDADTLYMWGENGNGQIGDNTTTNRYVPTKITPQGQSDWGGNIIDLSLGANHSAITIDTDLDGYADTLYIWGYNSSGQIGDGTTSNKLTPTIITPDGQSDWDGNIIDLSLGNYNSSIDIDTDLDGYADTLYIWGSNSSGQIGDGTTSNKLTPTIITPDGQSDWGGNIIDLSLGDGSFGVTINTDLDKTSADTLYMWGYNDYGQIGDGKSESIVLSPKIITPNGQSDWGGNIIDLSLGNGDSGLIIDLDNDGYGDTLYIWGNNQYGQIGNGESRLNEEYPFIIISTYYDFIIRNLDFYTNQNIEIDLKLDDYQDIINQNPEVILMDSEDNNYTTTFIEDKSNIDNDQYYYQLDNTLSGENYHFTDILINDNQFNLNQNIMTDYLISDYTFVSSTEETITINLNLDQNSNDFNISDYTEDQRKIKVNYTNIDNINNNVSDSQQFILDENSEITLTNLNSETYYKIDSIQYFYQNENYKYTIEQETKIFQTSAATPLINADSISLIENSITTTSFEYTIEIDNLKENIPKDNFTQYDINNGIWLVDQNNQVYNSSFINARIISNGKVNGTENYEITFLQEGLLLGETYDFIGIGFNDPNGSNPDTIDFSSPFEITTIEINKKFVDNTFEINHDSITSNSFEYTIEIDNLILIDDNQEKPIFLNFNLDEMLYLKDQDDISHSSSYINNSAKNLGSGEEEGTVKYQFSFKVGNLKENTTYNFVSLSFTESFEEAIDISEAGMIKTNDNKTTESIIYTIIVILVILLIFILILLYVDLRMKKKTKEISRALDNPDQFDK